MSHCVITKYKLFNNKNIYYSMDLSSFNLILCMIKRDQHACALWNEIYQMYNMLNAFKGEIYNVKSHSKLEPYNVYI